MNVLLTNDDGIDGAGLLSLAAVLSKKHSVFVIAPDRNQSGASSRMSVFDPLSVKEHPIEGCAASFSLSGTPVDCVIAAINGPFIGKKLDCVISGINDGSNIGTDIIYSGTCAAARQGSFMGVPGIAVSVDTDFLSARNADKSPCFESTARFTLANLERLVTLCGEARRLDSAKSYYPFFVNVNTPAAARYRGARLSAPCVRRYTDSLVATRGAEGATLSLRGNAAQKTLSYDAAPDAQSARPARALLSDYAACGEGFVSVSAIRCEPVCSAAELPADFFTV